MSAKERPRARPAPPGTSHLVQQALVPRVPANAGVRVAVHQRRRRVARHEDDVPRQPVRVERDARVDAPRHQRAAGGGTPTGGTGRAAVAAVLVVARRRGRVAAPRGAVRAPQARGRLDEAQPGEEALEEGGAGESGEEGGGEAEGMARRETGSK